MRFWLSFNWINLSNLSLYTLFLHLPLASTTASTCFSHSVICSCSNQMSSQLSTFNFPNWNSRVCVSSIWSVSLSPSLSFSFSLFLSFAWLRSSACSHLDKCLNAAASPTCPIWLLKQLCLVATLGRLFRILSTASTKHFRLHFISSAPPYILATSLLPSLFTPYSLPLCLLFSLSSVSTL